jgi:hypothetical protein
MHINLRNNLSRIHCFMCVGFIYFRIRVLCNDCFIYLLFNYIVMFIDLHMCDLSNNVSFIYL